MTAADCVAVDFETFYDSKTKYSLKNMSTWDYIHDPRFRAYWVGIHAPDLHYSGPVETAPWSKLTGRPLCSHNAAFDAAILTFLQKQGVVPALHTPRTYDTIDAVRYLQQPADLGRAVKAVLGKTHDKGFRAVMDGKRFEDLDEGQMQQLSVYGGDDARYCWELMEHTLPLWPETEQRLSELNRVRGVEGLCIDRTALDAAIEVMQNAHFNLLKQMPWVPSRKPLSPEAVREQGRHDGIPVPSSLKLDDPAAKQWEETYAKSFPWVAAVRGFRRVNMMLKKLQTWRERIRPDGTAPFQLKYFGAAATGRFSGGGGFNIQNLGKRPMVVCKQCWNCNLEYLDEDEPISDDYEIDDPCKICGADTRFVIDIRGMVLAPPGHSLVIADYSQIEARLLLWRAGDTAMLNRIRQGYHIYEAYAREHMGWTGGKLKDENKSLYALSKACCLAEDDLVLTSRGYIPINRVKDTDAVWDGRSWVSHDGVLNTGVAEYGDLVHFFGESYTVDHRIFRGENSSDSAQSVQEGKHTFQYLAWRNPPDSDWADLWKLACAVGQSLAHGWIPVCQVRMRKMREGARSKLEQFKERAKSSLRHLRRSRRGQEKGGTSMGVGL